VAHAARRRQRSKIPLLVFSRPLDAGEAINGRKSATWRRRLQPSAPRPAAFSDQGRLQLAAFAPRRSIFIWCAPIDEPAELALLPQH